MRCRGRVCDQSRTALSAAEEAKGLVSAFETLRLALDAPLPLPRGEVERSCACELGEACGMKSRRSPIFWDSPLQSVPICVCGFEQLLNFKERTINSSIKILTESNSF